MNEFNYTIDDVLGVLNKAHDYLLDNIDKDLKRKIEMQIDTLINAQSDRDIYTASIVLDSLLNNSNYHKSIKRK